MIRHLILTAMMLLSFAAAPARAAVRETPMKFEVEPVDSALGLYFIWASGDITPGATAELQKLASGTTSVRPPSSSIPQEACCRKA